MFVTSNKMINSLAYNMPKMVVHATKSQNDNDQIQRHNGDALLHNYTVMRIMVGASGLNDIWCAQFKRNNRMLVIVFAMGHIQFVNDAILELSRQNNDGSGTCISAIADHLQCLPLIDIHAMLPLPSTTATPTLGYFFSCFNAEFIVYANIDCIAVIRKLNQQLFYLSMLKAPKHNQPAINAASNGQELENVEKKRKNKTERRLKWRMKVKEIKRQRKQQQQQQQQYHNQSVTSTRSPQISAMVKNSYSHHVQTQNHQDVNKQQASPMNAAPPARAAAAQKKVAPKKEKKQRVAKKQAIAAKNEKKIAKKTGVGHAKPKKDDQSTAKRNRSRNNKERDIFCIKMCFKSFMRNEIDENGRRRVQDIRVYDAVRSAAHKFSSIWYEASTYIHWTLYSVLSSGDSERINLFFNSNAEQDENYFISFFHYVTRTTTGRRQNEIPEHSIPNANTAYWRKRHTIGKLPFLRPDVTGLSGVLDSDAHRYQTSFKNNIILNAWKRVRRFLYAVITTNNNNNDDDNENDNNDNDNDEDDEDDGGVVADNVNENRIVIKNTMNSLFRHDANPIEFANNANAINQLIGNALNALGLNANDGRRLLEHLLDLEHNWFRVVPLFYRIQMYNEQHRPNYCNFVIVPENKGGLVYHAFDTKTMRCVLFKTGIDLSQLKANDVNKNERSKREFWRKFFDFERLETGQLQPIDPTDPNDLNGLLHAFDCRILTNADGGVSVQMKRPKQQEQQQQHHHTPPTTAPAPSTSKQSDSPPPQKKARMQRLSWPQTPPPPPPPVIQNVNGRAYIGAGDPGYESIISAVSINPLRPRRRLRQFKLTAKHFRFMCNEHVRRSKLIRWTRPLENARRVYIEAQPQPPSAKSANHFEAYIDYRFTFMQRHQRVYCQRKIARQRIEKYICEHRACDRLTTLMCRRLNLQHDSIFFWGDANFAPNAPIRGHVRVSHRRFRSYLSRKCRVYAADEFRTSMLCSKCFGVNTPLRQSRLRQQPLAHQRFVRSRFQRRRYPLPDNEEEPRRPQRHRTVACPNCGRTWSRDPNAARCILYRGRTTQMLGANLHPNFTRNVRKVDIRPRDDMQQQ